MGRSRKKKLKDLQKFAKWDREIAMEDKKKIIPINNLPDKYLTMQVKYGTKIRKVLEYAIKNFSNFNDTIVWEAEGQAIGKAITCAEIFKRKIPNMHQLNHLCNETTEIDQSENKKVSCTPHIYIVLCKSNVHSQKPGYQAPNDTGIFDSSENDNSKNQDKDSNVTDSVASEEKAEIMKSAAQEFTSMGLQSSLKRPNKNPCEASAKKKKKKKSSDDS
ncbi:hypothetical protein TKK_0018048 [Trichogramma kaykai]